jgi:hypothetical protein
MIWSYPPHQRTEKKFLTCKRQRKGNQRKENQRKENQRKENLTFDLTRSTD